jgi:hypothetical protein
MVFCCHPEPPVFGERGIWASRALFRVLGETINRAFGSLPYQTAPLPAKSSGCSFPRIPDKHLSTYTTGSAQVGAFFRGSWTKETRQEWE